MPRKEKVGGEKIILDSAGAGPISSSIKWGKIDIDAASREGGGRGGPLHQSRRRKRRKNL